MTSSSVTKATHINQIPFELLSEIFSFACDISSPVSFQGHTTTAYPATVLSHVCSHWRSWITSDSRLWSRIIIREFLNGISPERVTKIHEIVELHLTRSGELPLDIVIEFTECTAEEKNVTHIPISLQTHGPPYLLYIYELIFNNAHRWRHVALCIDLTVFENMFAPTWPSHFPLLKNLHIHVFSQSLSEFIPSIEIASAPFLETLTHTGLGITICGSGRSTRALPNLRSLTLSDAMDEDTLQLASPATIVTMQEIGAAVGRNKKLCLSQEVHFFLASNQHIKFMCSQLNLPNVARLRFEASPGTLNFPFPYQDIISVQHVSRSMLTHFTLINIPITDLDILSLLSHLESLTHLAIGEFGAPDPTLTQKFFTSLTYKHRAQKHFQIYDISKLPQLRELHLAFGYALDFPDVVFDMIRSRTPGLGEERDLRLQIVRLFAPDNFKFVGIPLLTNQLYHAGLDFILYWVFSRDDWKWLGLGNWIS
ncbi:hypothetical protein VKT23_012343 [Stygiomarasmius scandens]|uniref:F-box domain-containing protein n=1 Tax=Marasmiellus scandens TaxID=2682957 RepID=A0ABR1J953_9AGAR